MAKIINQREKLHPDTDDPTSKWGKCPYCDIVELEEDRNGYIICSECTNPYHITIYHSFT